MPLPSWFGSPTAPQLHTPCLSLLFISIPAKPNIRVSVCVQCGHAMWARMTRFGFTPALPCKGGRPLLCAACAQASTTSPACGWWTTRSGRTRTCLDLGASPQRARLPSRTLWGTGLGLGAAASTSRSCRFPQVCRGGWGVQGLVVGGGAMWSSLRVSACVACVMRVGGGWICTRM
jgi:hypothetical protein